MPNSTMLIARYGLALEPLIGSSHAGLSKSHSLFSPLDSENSVTVIGETPGLDCSARGSEKNSSASPRSFFMPSVPIPFCDANWPGP